MTNTPHVSHLTCLFIHLQILLRADKKSGKCLPSPILLITRKWKLCKFDHLRWLSSMTTPQCWVWCVLMICTCAQFWNYACYILNESDMVQGTFLPRIHFNTLQKLCVIATANLQQGQPSALASMQFAWSPDLVAIMLVIAIEPVRATPMIIIQYSRFKHFVQRVYPDLIRGWVACVRAILSLAQGPINETRHSMTSHIMMPIRFPTSRYSGPAAKRMRLPTLFMASVRHKKFMTKCVMSQKCHDCTHSSH